MIALPRTDTRRGAVHTLTLIERVSLDPRIPAGLAFEGDSFRPGSSIDPDLLLKGYRESGSPVLVLEATEAEDTTYVGPLKRRWVLLYVLWRYDVERAVWIELARLMAPCAYSSMELRQVAHRILQPETLREVETIEASAGRLHAYIDQEVKQLEVGRIAVLELLLHRIVSRIVEDRGSLEWPGRRRARTVN